MPSKEVYKRRKEEGFCVQCGVAKPKLGILRCERCASLKNKSIPVSDEVQTLFALFGEIFFTKKGIVYAIHLGTKVIRKLTEKQFERTKILRKDVHKIKTK